MWILLIILAGAVGLVTIAARNDAREMFVSSRPELVMFKSVDTALTVASNGFYVAAFLIVLALIAFFAKRRN